MRIGALIKSDVFNTYYRALGPLSALRDLGHGIEVVETDEQARFDPKALLRCDVVHIYRRAEPEIQALVDELHRRGIGVTWDNDDDIRRVPKGSPQHNKAHGMRAARDFQLQVKMMRRVDVVTTPSAVLAEMYRESGAEDVRHVENYLMPEQYASPSRGSDGMTIAWVAGLEHRADAATLDISGVLRRVQARHPNVRVVTVGVRLELDPARYTHHRGIPFFHLKDHLRQFDIGIAPLADIPMSYARSNVKVKEYAAASLPWLASDRGPYEGLGPKQGGELVADDGWEAALERLIGSRLTRYRLRKRAAAWAKEQSTARHVEQWLEIFERAVERAGERQAHEGSRRAVAGRGR